MWWVAFIESNLLFVAFKVLWVVQTFCGEGILPVSCFLYIDHRNCSLLLFGHRLQLSFVHVLQDWKPLFDSATVGLLILAWLLTTLFTVIRNFARKVILTIFHEILECFWCCRLCIKWSQFGQIVLEFVIVDYMKFGLLLSWWLSSWCFVNISKSKQLSCVEYVRVSLSDALAPSCWECNVPLWATWAYSWPDSFEPLYEEEILRCYP